MGLFVFIATAVIVMATTLSIADCFSSRNGWVSLVMCLVMIVLTMVQVSIAADLVFAPQQGTDLSRMYVPSGVIALLGLMALFSMAFDVSMHADGQAGQA